MNEDKITLRDIYDAVDRLERKLNERIDKQDTKIENLQSFQNKALGIISFATLIFSTLISYFWKKVLPE